VQKSVLGNASCNADRYPMTNTMFHLDAFRICRHAWDELSQLPLPVSELPCRHRHHQVNTGNLPLDSPSILGLEARHSLCIGVPVSAKMRRRALNRSRDVSEIRRTKARARDAHGWALIRYYCRWSDWVVEAFKAFGRHCARNQVRSRDLCCVTET
jgi:hypothetical protein